MPDGLHNRLCHTFLVTCVAHNVRMYRFLPCVCVSVRVPKTDIFIPTSHFAFTWEGVWTHSGMSVCLFVRSGPKNAFKRIETAQTHLKT